MSRPICSAFVLGLAILAQAEEEPAIKLSPLHFGAAQEWGSVVSGLYKAGNANAEPAKNDWIDHFTAYLSQEAVVNDRLFVTAGLGGVFQYRKPEKINAGFSGSQHKSFFVGPSTEAVYHFGDPEKPWLQLGVGNFFYKYNDDANDLGEYLFRSAAYPTYTITGGYNVIGSANSQLQGFKGLFRFGNFSADLLLFTQTGYAPLFDWSPAVVASYKIGDGLLNLGAGANFSHLIEVKPSRSETHLLVNGYFSGPDGKEYSTNTDYYNNRLAFDQGKLDTALKYSDAAAAADYRAKVIVDSTEAALVNGVVTPGAVGPEIKYFNARSTLLMARATLDPKKLFESDIMGPQDLKLYAELGVLGVENKPVWYKKVTERMPIMVGFNIPTFKLLDLFAVQGEYMNSPWINNTYEIGNFAANVPFVPVSSDNLLSRNNYNDMSKRDNIKWAVFLKKSFGNVSFMAQAANDHLHLTSSEYYYGPQFDHGEVTVSSKDWYFMTQVAWGM